MKSPALLVTVRAFHLRERKALMLVLLPRRYCGHENQGSLEMYPLKKNGIPYLVTSRGVVPDARRSSCLWSPIVNVWAHSFSCGDIPNISAMQSFRTCVFLRTWLHWPCSGR